VHRRRVGVERRDAVRSGGQHGCPTGCRKGVTARAGNARNTSGVAQGQSKARLGP